MTRLTGLVRTLLSLLVLGSAACGDLAGNAALPAGTQSPNAYNTPTGALAMVRGTRSTIQSLLATYIKSSGLLSDELTTAGIGSGPQSIGGVGDPTDERILSEELSGGDATYAQLQQVRASAAQAIGLLTAYAPTTSPALRGTMYAFAGFAELSLAELYCSGVPLSTLDFQQDFTYKPSSTTEEVTRHAQALLDSAIALSSDSVRVLRLAQVLKGRALLDRGQYDSAAFAVATVPDTFRYQVSAVMDFHLQTDRQAAGPVVATREGNNGLPFSTANDPRAPVTFQFNNQFQVPLYLPAQYAMTVAPVPVVLASGVEARLIEAEAALHRGDPTWLTTLNQLRTNGIHAATADTVTDTLGVTNCGPDILQCGVYPGGSDASFGQPAGGFSVPAGYSFAFADTTSPAPPGIKDYCNSYSYYMPCYVGDTMVVIGYVKPGPLVWQAGTAGVIGLPPLADPGLVAGSDSAQVTLLFTERAYWLFLTGHRQGDLRRLVRNYGRDQRTVYPVGAYYGGLGQYGRDVNLPIPGDERLNPLFHGCLNRGA